MTEIGKMVRMAMCALAATALTACDGVDRDSLRRQVADRDVAIKTCEQKLAECQANDDQVNTAQGPGGTTIIIQPPGSGGNNNNFTIGASTAQPTLTGVNLDERAYGPIKKFRGVVKIAGQEYERDIVGLTAKFGGKTLTIERSATTPEVFVWKLDGEPMTMVTGQDEGAWNDTLCGALDGDIELQVKKLGGGTDPATGVRIEIYAKAW